MLAKKKMEQVHFRDRLQSALDAVSVPEHYNTEAFKAGYKEGLEIGFKIGFAPHIPFCERMLSLPPSPIEELMHLSVDELEAKATALDQQLIERESK